MVMSIETIYATAKGMARGSRGCFVCSRGMRESDWRRSRGSRFHALFSFYQRNSLFFLFFEGTRASLFPYKCTEVLQKLYFTHVANHDRRRLPYFGWKKIALYVGSIPNNSISFVLSCCAASL